jgi:hypothetical protein
MAVCLNSNGISFGDGTTLNNAGAAGVTLGNTQYTPYGFSISGFSNAIRKSPTLSPTYRQSAGSGFNSGSAGLWVPNNSVMTGMYFTAGYEGPTGQRQPFWGVRFAYRSF